MQLPRVALVYDRVNTPHGGAEKVLLALHQAFPQAPLYTSVYDQDQAQWANVFELRSSFLQNFPFANKLHRWLAPLMPLAFESFNLDEFDIIISVTSAEAKGVLTKPHQLHVCYLLTPTRYLYSHRQDYLETLPKIPFVKEIAIDLLNYLAWWDQSAARRPDIYLPISKLVGQRCREFYHQEPQPVIYPPVEVLPVTKTDQAKTFEEQSCELGIEADQYYVVVSRLVPYKRIDLAIRACTELKRKLVIVGEGPELSKLKEKANDSNNLITFLGNQSQTKVNALLHHCRGLLMPGLEDFGITALEAVAVGKPAVIHYQSGVAELIKDKKTGIHLKKLTVEAMKEALVELEATQFDSQHLIQSVRKYATTTFVQNMQTRILEYWQQFRERKS
jgi:glycosyltransferase involved in cell wall biosynthesis